MDFEGYKNERLKYDPEKKEYYAYRMVPPVQNLKYFFMSNNQLVVDRKGRREKQIIEKIEIDAISFISLESDSES